MASQNRIEMASILNDSAFRWSFGSPCEYVRLLESFLKINNLPVPKFPENFIANSKSGAQTTPCENITNNLFESSVSTQSTSQVNTFFGFPSYSNTSYSSNTTPSKTSGYSSSPTVKLSFTKHLSQPSTQEVSLKELLFHLLWDLIKQYKITCNGNIPEDVQRFLDVQSMVPPMENSELSKWYVWVSRRINVILGLMGLTRKFVVKMFVDREVENSTERDMIMDTLLDMLRANKV